MPQAQNNNHLPVDTPLNQDTGWPIPALLDRINDGVYAIDKDWRYTYLNKRAAELLGQPREEALGKNAWELFPEAIKLPFYNEAQRVIREQQPAHFEAFYPLLNTWFASSIYPSSEGITVIFEDISHRKQAEAELQFKSTILDNLHHSVIVTDLQGHVTYWSKGASELFGYRAEEMLGKTPVLLYPDMDQNKLAQDLGEVAEGKDYIGEWQGRRKNGTTVWIDIRTTLCRNTFGEAIGFIGVATDITKRKRAEDAQRLSENRVARLMEATLIGIVIADEAYILEANDAFLEMIGYTREEFEQGKISWLEITPPEYISQDRQVLRELLESGEYAPFEKEYSRKDGSRIPVMLGAVKLQDEPLQAIGFVLDISERKQIEDELAKRTQAFQMLADNIPDVITRHDRNFRYLYVNPAIESITGIPPHAFLGKTFWEVGLSEEECRFFETQVAQVFRTGELTIVEYSFPSTAGIEQHLQSSLVPERDAQGTIVSILVITRDVTASKELEKRRDAFIGMASHELKTPITVLRGWTQLLKRHLERRGLHEPMATLDKMDIQITRLTRLVSELLDVSKIQAGKLDYIAEPIDLDALVKEAAEMLQPSSPHHTISVRGVSGATVIGDSDRLLQVLINLVTNAIKYSPQADKVDIALATTENTVTVQVQDYGIGIHKDHLQKIFDRFYRVHHEKNKIFPGLGMGLYISSEIIKRHGGTITVESKEGRGSIFSLTLPLAKEEQKHHHHDKSEEQWQAN